MSTVTVNATATTATACGCCGTLEAATLQCRTRGGTAVLIGHSEFSGGGTPSSPPKKYLVKTAGGTLFDCAYNTTNCTGSPAAGAKYIYSGSCIYNENTGATTNTLLFQQFNDGGTCTATTQTVNTAQACNWADTSTNTSACELTTVVTLNRIDRTGTNTCCPNLPAPGNGLIRTGSNYWELTVEDTNQNAINRLLAGAGGTWGAWLSPGATGCTGTPPPCCLARWEERTSDFDFVYAEAEYRVTASGLTPSTAYGARVEIYRSVYGANSYSLFQTLIVNGTTDGSGNFSEDGAVPNEEGFESYAAAAYIIMPP